MCVHPTIHPFSLPVRKGDTHAETITFMFCNTAKSVVPQNKSAGLEGTPGHRCPTAASRLLLYGQRSCSDTQMWELIQLFPTYSGQSKQGGHRETSPPTTFTVASRTIQTPCYLFSNNHSAADDSALSWRMHTEHTKHPYGF